METWKRDRGAIGLRLNPQPPTQIGSATVPENRRWRRICLLEVELDWGCGLDWGQEIGGGTQGIASCDFAVAPNNERNGGAERKRERERGKARERKKIKTKIKERESW